MEEIPLALHFVSKILSNGLILTNDSHIYALSDTKVLYKVFASLFMIIINVSLPWILYIVRQSFLSGYCVSLYVSWLRVCYLVSLLYFGFLQPVYRLLVDLHFMY